MKTRFQDIVRRLFAKPQRLTALFLIGLVLLYGIWLTYVIAGDRPLDFYVYYIAAEDMARGGNPYTITSSDWDSLAADLQITNYTSPYRYPPHTAALLTLFRPLGPRLTMTIWVSASALAMIAAAWLIGNSLGGGWWIPVALGSLFFFVAPLATLLAGQTNGFVLLCLAIAFAGLKSRKVGWSAGALALGTALKVIPLALILYTFWRRQWRTALASIGMLVILTVVILPIVGSSVIAGYVQNAITLGSSNTAMSAPTIQTWTGVLGRALPTSPDLAVAGGRWLGLLMIVATAVLCWPTGDAELLMPLEFSLIVAALQLIPPFVWYHQFVLLLIPLVVSFQQLWNSRRWKWLGLLTVLFVLSGLHGLAWRFLADISPWLASFPFLLGLTLWGTLAWLIMQRKWRTATEVSPQPVL